MIEEAGLSPGLGAKAVVAKHLGLVRRWMASEGAGSHRGPAHIWIQILTSPCPRRGRRKPRSGVAGRGATPEDNNNNPNSSNRDVVTLVPPAPPAAQLGASATARVEPHRRSARVRQSWIRSAVSFEDPDSCADTDSSSALDGSSVFPGRFDTQKCHPWDRNPPESPYPSMNRPHQPLRRHHQNSLPPLRCAIALLGCRVQHICALPNCATARRL